MTAMVKERIVVVEDGADLLRDAVVREPPRISIEALRAQVDGFAKRHAAAALAAPEMREMLIACEWGCFDGSCPSCEYDNDIDGGHHADCALAALLERIR